MVRFGPFAIDARTWTLSRDGEALNLSPRLVQILSHLVDRDGAIVTKDDLLERFWPDVHVTENTLTRAIADIRKALQDSPDHPTVIQTMARRGYRFAGTTRPVSPDEDPFRLWVSGRLALERLDAPRLGEARAAMEAVAASMPDYAPAHAGVANACVAAFEVSRLGNQPDVALLSQAVTAAQRALEIDPRLGEGWAVLAHARALSGAPEDAQAAARHAVALEPGNWRHHFRLALASWGEDRLRAADRALACLPSCAAAHLLSAMVFVARGAWTHARSAADTGARLQDAQSTGAVLPAAGLHWMRGLVLTATGELDDALTAFSQETQQSADALYGREFHWLAHAASGFLHLHGGQREAAAHSFKAAELLNPGAARNLVGLHLGGEVDQVEVKSAIDHLAHGRKAEATLLAAGLLAWRGQQDPAMNQLGGLIGGAPPGPVGWNLGADPFFLPLRGHDRWPALMAALAARAA